MSTAISNSAWRASWFLSLASRLTGIFRKQRLCERKLANLSLKGLAPSFFGGLKNIHYSREELGLLIEGNGLPVSEQLVHGNPLL
jgi:hypothetical protein